MRGAWALFVTILVCLLVTAVVHLLQYYPLMQCQKNTDACFKVDSVEVQGLDSCSGDITMLVSSTMHNPTSGAELSVGTVSLAVPYKGENAFTSEFDPLFSANGESQESLQEGSNTIATTIPLQKMNHALTAEILARLLNKNTFEVEVVAELPIHLRVIGPIVYNLQIKMVMKCNEFGCDFGTYRKKTDEKEKKANSTKLLSIRVGDKDGTHNGSDVTESVKLGAVLRVYAPVFKFSLSAIVPPVSVDVYIAPQSLEPKQLAILDPVKTNSSAYTHVFTAPNTANGGVLPSLELTLEPFPSNRTVDTFARALSHIQTKRDIFLYVKGQSSSGSSSSSSSSSGSGSGDGSCSSNLQRVLDELPPVMFPIENNDDDNEENADETKDPIKVRSLELYGCEKGLSGR